MTPSSEGRRITGTHFGQFLDPHCGTATRSAGMSSVSHLVWVINLGVLVYGVDFPVQARHELPDGDGSARAMIK